LKGYQRSASFVCLASNTKWPQVFRMMDLIDKIISPDAMVVKSQVTNAAIIKLSSTNVWSWTLTRLQDIYFRILQDSDCLIKYIWFCYCACRTCHAMSSHLLGWASHIETSYHGQALKKMMLRTRLWIEHPLNQKVLWDTLRCFEMLWVDD
jgi:hypothetical protein